MTEDVMATRLEDVRRAPGPFGGRFERSAYRARKAARRSYMRADDSLDRLRLRIRRDPLGSVLIAAGAGLALGAVAGLVRRHEDASDER
jgi:hypothetical protein